MNEHLPMTHCKCDVYLCAQTEAGQRKPLLKQEKPRPRKEKSAQKLDNILTGILTAARSCLGSSPVVPETCALGLVPASGPAVLKLEPASESPGRLSKTQTAKPHPQGFCTRGRGWGQRTGLSSQSPDDTAAAGPGTAL